ncbi:hypothetical protein M8C21_025386, partial [Ambrosia artemisiifolia]
PILLSIILYIFFNVYLSQKSKTSKTNLPPGSFGWPFIGESLSLLRAGWDGVPERFVRERIEKHGSPLVFKTSLLGDHVAVLCGPAGNKFLFGNENKLVAAWWPSSVRKLFGRCLITIRGDEAKWMRKMLLSYLGPEAFVSHYATTMDVVTRRHIEVHWRGKEEVNVYQTVKDRGSTEVAITDNNFDFSDFLPFEVAAKEAGELLKWEDIQKMRYSWNVVSEVMRLNPPVMGAFREALVDFEYAGYNIPKGWKLYWSSSLAHKDEANFEDVTRFDPSRFEGAGPTPYTYVPFGGGPRMCLGKEFSRLEVLAFLHNIVTLFKWDLLIPNEKIEYDPMATPANGLPIRLHPHQFDKLI